MEDVYTLGLDIGAAAAKCVLLKNGAELIASAVVPSGVRSSGAKKAAAAVLESAKISRDMVACVTATGYGRNIYGDADLTLSELSCHALGAYSELESVKTVIDIGGQDVKAIRVGKNGTPENFVMNDKCAAGTGRFLEVMARILELEVSELEKVGEKAKNPVMISSTCTVFAESEVISRLAADTDISDIVAGIHNSVAVKAAGLARMLKVEEPVVMTGGVAKNGGVVKAVERELGVKIHIPPFPQLNGAYGAAVHAWRNVKKR